MDLWEFFLKDAAMCDLRLYGNMADTESHSECKALSRAPFFFYSVIVQHHVDIFGQVILMSQIQRTVECCMTIWPG